MIKICGFKKKYELLLRIELIHEILKELWSLIYNIYIRELRYNICTF